MADKYEYKKFEYDVPWDAEGKYNNFTPSAETNTAMTNKANAEKAYSDFVGAGYTWANQQMLDDYMAKYQNRDPFSYDFNTDAMYQQYKDKYMKQGKMAMQDTMGQAAAMTGGYGSSYASTAGNQAYQASLENLNDIIPQLYEMAYNRYNQEGQDMLNNISLLQSERGFDYGVWGDKANMLAGDRSYYQTDANNLWNRDYGVWNDNRTFDRGVYESDRAIAQSDHTNSENINYNEFVRAAEESAKVIDQTPGTTYKVDDSGNLVPVPAATVTDGMREKAKTFTDNESLAEWAYSLEDSGAIAPGEAAKLIAEFYDHNEKYVEVDSRRGGKDKVISYSEMVKNADGWTRETKGGGNLFGIDANARVVSPNGQSMRLDDLRDKLIAEGMDKSEATKYIKNLQQKLKISSNWFFGL